MTEKTGRTSGGSSFDDIPVLDAHVHVWDPHAHRYAWLDDEPGLDRPFSLAGYAAATDGVVDAMVLVQAGCSWSQSFDEARWLAGLACGNPDVLAVIAGVQLESDTATADVARLAELDLVRGVRRLIQDEPAGFALEPAFVAGVRSLAGHGLTMDLCVRHHQLAEVTRLVQQCADVHFVLDHAGKPDIAGRKFETWSVALERLAGLSNVVCKLSGLTTEADPSTMSDIPRYLQHVLDVFGPERVMFGSDWPVCTIRTDWASWRDTVDQALAGYGRDERRAVLGGNARRVYLRRGLLEPEGAPAGGSARTPRGDVGDTGGLLRRRRNDRTAGSAGDAARRR